MKKKYLKKINNLNNHNFFLVLYLSDLQCYSGESLGTMSIDLQRRKMYVGGKNIFYIFDLNNALSDASSVRNYTWPAMDTVIDSCTMKGTQFWECQNYIQVLLYNEVQNRLLVCGTNAQAPRCRYFQVSTSQLFVTIIMNIHYNEYLVYMFVTFDEKYSDIIGGLKIASSNKKVAIELANECFFRESQVFRVFFISTFLLCFV